MLFRFKKNKQVSYRTRELYILLFFAVSFFIYGVMSAWFWLNPGIDPLQNRVADTPSSTLVITGLFLAYGLYCLVFRHKLMGKLFGLVVLCEAAIRLAFMTTLQDVPVHIDRLSGAIEGTLCFAFFAGAMVFARRGRSIWD